MLCLQSEKEEKEVEKDVEENKQKEEKETKWSCLPPAVVVLYTFLSSFWCKTMKKRNYKHILYKHFWNNEILRVICVAFCKKDKNEWISYVYMSRLEQFDGCFPIWTFCEVSIIPLCLLNVTRTTPSSLCCTHPSLSVLAWFVC